MNTPSLTARLAAAACFLLAALPAAAHPGHAWWHHGAVHTLTSSWHLATFAAAGGLLILAARWIQRPLLARPIRAAGAACWLATLALWSLS